MPYFADPVLDCATCPYGDCIEDRRVNRVANRDTKFRLKQATILGCTFDSFVPGCDSDTNPDRTFDEYIGQMRMNATEAGKSKFPGGAFKLDTSAVAKVEGDVFELLEAAALWNAAAAWNRFMDTGLWTGESFTQPVASVATPTRKIAIVKLPRGYDATKLFKPEVRATIQAFEQAMTRNDVMLGLSSPDIVGVRLPHPLPPALGKFLVDTPRLDAANINALEWAYRDLEGQLDSSAFLLAIAVKRTTRSDRLYQPLYEATVLKFHIEYVLRGAAFRFYVHLGSYQGANVVKAYKAALLTSLIRGGTTARAVDKLYHAVSPRATAQSILDDLPLFPI
jgi:hypothetical protein